MTPTCAPNTGPAGYRSHNARNRRRARERREWLCIVARPLTSARERSRSALAEREMAHHPRQLREDRTDARGASAIRVLHPAPQPTHRWYAAQAVLSLASVVVRVIRSSLRDGTRDRIDAPLAPRHEYPRIVSGCSVSAVDTAPSMTPVFARAARRGMPGTGASCRGMRGGTVVSPGSTSVGSPPNSQRVQEALSNRTHRTDVDLSSESAVVFGERDGGRFSAHVETRRAHDGASQRSRVHAVGHRARDHALVEAAAPQASATRQEQARVGTRDYHSITLAFFVPWHLGADLAAHVAPQHRIIRD